MRSLATKSDVHKAFQDRRVWQDLISKVLFITAGRVFATFRTIILFVLLSRLVTPGILYWIRLITSIVSIPLVLGIFLGFVFSRKARTSFPLNAYLASAFWLESCLLTAHRVHDVVIVLPFMQDRPKYLPVAYVLLAWLILLTANLVAIKVLVRNSWFDFSGCCSVLWQTILTVLLVHLMLGHMSATPCKSDFLLIYSLLFSPSCIIACLFVLLVLRSILVLGWLGPSDYVAASIYANDPLIYFISLCTEVKRPINQLQQVTQPPINAPAQPRPLLN